MADIKAQLKDILSENRTYRLTTNVEDYFDHIYMDDKFHQIYPVYLNWRKYGSRDITEYLESEIAIDILNSDKDVIYTIAGDEIISVDVADTGFLISSYEGRAFYFVNIL